MNKNNVYIQITCAPIFTNKGKDYSSDNKRAKFQNLTLGYESWVYYLFFVCHCYARKEMVTGRVLLNPQSTRIE